MRPLYIFDVDGTLALIASRRWDEFYAACVDDKPNVPVVRTLNSLCMHNDIWFFSGRSDVVRAQTIDWLQRHTILFNSRIDCYLTMRRHGDYTPDHELKRDWLRNMLDVDRQRLVAIFEDRARNVRMWRSEGVVCFQVADGEF